MRNAAELRRCGADAEEPLLDALLEVLHEYSPDLYFEIGGFPGDKTELVITAEGNRDAFDAVRSLIDAAPELAGWEFSAFKRPQVHGNGYMPST